MITRLATLSIAACLLLIPHAARATCVSSCTISLIDAECLPLEGAADPERDGPIGFIGRCSDCCSGDWQCMLGWSGNYASESECNEDGGHKIAPECDESALDACVTQLEIARVDDVEPTAIGDFVQHPSCVNALTFTGSLAPNSAYQVSLAGEVLLHIDVAMPGSDATSSERGSDAAGAESGGCQLAPGPAFDQAWIALLLALAWIFRVRGMPKRR